MRLMPMSTTYQSTTYQLPEAPPPPKLPPPPLKPPLSLELLLPDQEPPEDEPPDQPPPLPRRPGVDEVMASLNITRNAAIPPASAAAISEPKNTSHQRDQTAGRN